MYSFQNYLDFPYEEIRDPKSGDGFFSVEDAKKAGFDDDQIWSVVENGESHWVKTNGAYFEWECLTYGPPRHFINVLHYVATNERHDNDTYYEDWLNIERDQDEVDEILAENPDFFIEEEDDEDI